MNLLITELLLLITHLNSSFQYVFDGSKLDPELRRDERFAPQLQIRTTHRLDMSDWLNGQVIKLGNISEPTMTAIIDSIKDMTRSESVTFPRVKVFYYRISKEDTREILVYLDPENGKQWVINIEDLDMRHHVIVFRTGDLGFGFRKADTFVVLRKGILNGGHHHFIHQAYVRPKIKGDGLQVEWDNFKPKDILPIPIIFNEDMEHQEENCTPRSCGLIELMFGTCNIVRLSCEDIKEFPLSGHDKERIDSLIREQQPFIYDLAEILGRSKSYWVHLSKNLAVESAPDNNDSAILRKKRKIHMHPSRHHLENRRVNAIGLKARKERGVLSLAKFENLESEEVHESPDPQEYLPPGTGFPIETLASGLDEDEQLVEKDPLLFQNPNGKESASPQNEKASHYNDSSEVWLRISRAADEIDTSTQMSQLPITESNVTVRANSKVLNAIKNSKTDSKAGESANISPPTNEEFLNSSSNMESFGTKSSENETYWDQFVKNLRRNPPSKYTVRSYECVGCEPISTFLSDYEENPKLSPVVYNALADIIYNSIKNGRESENGLFSPEKHVVLQEHPTIPFVGFGNCDVSIEDLAHPPQSMEFDDIIDFYAETLAVKCGNWEKDCESERATGNLRKLLTSKHHLLEILDDLSVRFDKNSRIPKYGILSPNEFNQMMKSLIFSAYTTEYRRGQLRLINVDLSVQLNYGQSTSMKFLMKMVLRVVDRLIKDLPHHLIKGLRYLLQLLQDKFLALVMEHFGIVGYDFKGNERERIAHKQANAIDRLQVLTLKDFIINRVAPTMENGADIRLAFHKFFMRNRNRFISELLSYGVGNRKKIFQSAALWDNVDQFSNQKDDDDDDDNVNLNGMHFEKDELTLDFKRNAEKSLTLPNV